MAWRSGEHVNQMIYDIEREGMHAADKIIAVSHFTRNIIISRYGINGEKVEVVHNGAEHNGSQTFGACTINKDEKLVLSIVIPSPCFWVESQCRKARNIFLWQLKKSLSQWIMSNSLWPVPEI